MPDRNDIDWNQLYSDCKKKWNYIPQFLPVFVLLVSIVIHLHVPTQWVLMTHIWHGITGRLLFHLQFFLVLRSQFRNTDHRRIDDGQNDRRTTQRLAIANPDSAPD